jgi:hypothetical protein
MGVMFCAGCGARLELTDVEAHAQAVAAVRHENWERAFATMNRTLYFFGLCFVGALLFHAYATRDVMADFEPGAPLPPSPRLALDPAFVSQVTLPLPKVPAPPPLKAEDQTEAQILEELATTARDRLNCVVFLKTAGSIRGVLLSRTDDEVAVITGWDPMQVRRIRADKVDFSRSKFPE